MKIMTEEEVAEMIAAAIAAERERLAGACESLSKEVRDDGVTDLSMFGDMLAAELRRSEAATDEPSRTVCEHGVPENHACERCGSSIIDSQQTDSRPTIGDPPPMPERAALFEFECADCGGQLDTNTGECGQGHSGINRVTRMVHPERLNNAIVVAEYWQRIAAQRDAKLAGAERERNEARAAAEAAEAAEGRASELFRLLNATEAKLRATELKLDALLDERDKAGERLPECVAVARGVRGLNLDSVPECASNNTAARCLRWLATAPTASVSRIGLAGDVVAAVRRWCKANHWYREECLKLLREKCPPKDGVGWLIEVGEALDGAEVYDVSALGALFAALREWNFGRGVDSWEERRDIDAAFDALMARPEWRAFGEESSK